MLGPEGMLAQEASSNPASKASKMRILDMVFILVIARVIEPRAAELPVSSRWDRLAR
jgi:hypothetical protein